MKRGYPGRNTRRPTTLKTEIHTEKKVKRMIRSAKQRF